MKHPEEVEGGGPPLRRHAKKVLLALCLGTMVAGFATLGALGYQGWKLFHNPYRNPSVQANAPTPEAAAWAAEVYRLEKRDHLFITGLIEVAFVIVSTATWFWYRRLEVARGDPAASTRRRLRGPLVGHGEPAADAPSLPAAGPASAGEGGKKG